MQRRHNEGEKEVETNRRMCGIERGEREGEERHGGDCCRRRCEPPGLLWEVFLSEDGGLPKG